MNFKNAPFFIMLGIAISGWLMYFLKPEKVCPTCPEVTLSHTVKKDSSHFISVIPKDSIKLVKSIGIPGKNSIKKAVTGIPMSKDSGIIDTKKSFVDWVNMNDCDSLKTAHESSYTYEIPVSDSMMKGTVTQVISENKVQQFVFDRKYFFPIVTDSIVQKVTVPKEVTCLQIGTLFGGNQTTEILGLSVGYRNGKNDYSFTYDLINGNYLAGYKRDLRK